MEEGKYSDNLPNMAQDIMMGQLFLLK
jgi:hypothetical protein